MIIKLNIYKEWCLYRKSFITHFPSQFVYTVTKFHISPCTSAVTFHFNAFTYPASLVYIFLNINIWSPIYEPIFLMQNVPFFYVIIIFLVIQFFNKALLKQIIVLYLSRFKFLLPLWSLTLEYETHFMLQILYKNVQTWKSISGGWESN